MLKEGEDIIAEADFVLYDDGASIQSDSWKVTWHEDSVEVILSGDEQFDDQVILYCLYNGVKTLALRRNL